MVWGLLSIVPPLVSRHGNRGLALVIALLGSRLLFFSAKMTWFPFISTGLPTLAAAAVWGASTFSPVWWTATVWPMVAMGLFYAHPATAGAYWYPVWWLSVPLFALVVREHPFVRAWRATMTAHTVGALWVLYVGNGYATLWHSLQYIVGVERLCITLGMLLVAYVDASWGQVIAGRERA